MDEVKELQQKLAELDKESDKIRHQLTMIEREKNITYVKQVLKTHNFPFRVAVKPYKSYTNYDYKISLEVYDGPHAAEALQKLIGYSPDNGFIQVFDCDPVEEIYNPNKE